MNILTTAVILALIGAVATLVWGVRSMAQGGSYDQEHSEKLMFMRVGIQTAAVILIIAALLFSFS